MRGGSRKRYPAEESRHRDRRPPPVDEEYYDDEEDKYERNRPTRKPDKHRTTTKKYEKTTEAPQEEYEEYEYEEEEPKPPKKDETTTPAPHRFSTPSYKSTKTTSRSPVNYRRPKPPGDFERKYRPLQKRIETSTEEATTVKRPIVMKATVYPDRKFTSVVGSPSGFKKQDDKFLMETSTEPYREEEKPEPPHRRPLEGYRKQLANHHRRQQEADRDNKDESSHRTSTTSRSEKDDAAYKNSFPSSKGEKEDPSHRSPLPTRGEKEQSPYRNPLLNRGDKEESSYRNPLPSRAEKEELPYKNPQPQREEKEQSNRNPLSNRGDKVESSYRNPPSGRDNKEVFPSPSRGEKEEASYRAPPSSRGEESNSRYPYKPKEIHNNQRAEVSSSMNFRNSYSSGEGHLNHKETPPRTPEPQELPVSKSEESASEVRNPPRDEYKPYRPFTSRGQDISNSRSEESSGSSRYKEDQVQNGRTYPSRVTEVASSTENNYYRPREERPQRIFPSRAQDSISSEDNSKSRYNKEEIVQNGRVYPTRAQESPLHNENSGNNGYRTQVRGEDHNYRNQMTRQDNRPAENPTTNYRNSYSQEDRVSNFRNPTAIVDDVDYRNPAVSNEETNSNFRTQTDSTISANYRNPHASSDETEYRQTPDDSRYRTSLSNTNDAYQRQQEVRWPQKDEQQQYIPVQPSPQPPIEEVKPYITGPGIDENQDGNGKTGYPQAVTSPPRGYRRYNKVKVPVRTKPVTEENLDYNKYPLPEEGPKVEFTAPGPSAPQATPRPYLNLEEYDVTLNDALQPSTPYSRLKNRGYQSSVTQPHYRTGFLLTAASQAYPTKLSGEYEAVVVPAPRFSAKRRPHEWYW